MDEAAQQTSPAKRARKGAPRPPRRAERGETPASKSEQTRARILDAAAFVFARKGYSDARLSDIARTARMQTGSLYYHFASREELVAEVMRAGVEQVHAAVRARMETIPEGTPEVERLRLLLECHLLTLIDENDYTRAISRLLGQVPPRLQLQHSANGRQFMALWRGLLREGQASGALRADVDMSAIRMLLLGAMSWSIVWFKPENGPAELVARDFARMAVDGLRARPD
ncbi:TetR/AcrR family transcriptional regulator [Albimonas pacifica]|uniref:Transcriptional regulator, TetR family n=1 Tax=Albimonas pacifica TaxID=1114924 RepID=A0A1I3BYK5_9RHOB|nr:TetR/AcrR family transcriptional regulator [Albimonas pacifica]SFH67126.1 transcriptional regulator, TetR family [Albimonas pacifica]